jgi:hypothetical protein
MDCCAIIFSIVAGRCDGSGAGRVTCACTVTGAIATMTAEARVAATAACMDLTYDFVFIADSFALSLWPSFPSWRVYVSLRGIQRYEIRAPARPALFYSHLIPCHRYHDVTIGWK